MSASAPFGWSDARLRIERGMLRDNRDENGARVVPENIWYDVVPGFVSDAAPGLAVTPTVGFQRDIGVWCITHIESGAQVSAEGEAFIFETINEAVRVVERMRPILDWTRSRNALLAEAQNDPSVGQRLLALARAGDTTTLPDKPDGDEPRARNVTTLDNSNSSTLAAPEHAPTESDQ